MPEKSSALRAYAEVLALFALLLLEDVIIVALFSAIAGKGFYTEFREGRLRPPLSIVYVTVLYTVVLMTIIVYWRRLSRSPLRDCGLGITGSSGHELGGGSLIAAAAFTVFFGALAAAGAASTSPPPETLRAITPLAALAHAALNLPVCFAVAWTEELFFRGVVMHIFLKRVTPLHAVIATSALFALCHMFCHGSIMMKLFYGISLFLLGVILSLMVLKTGRLWMGIGFHGSLIFLSMLKDYFQVLKLGPGRWDWVYGLSSNPEAGIWSIVVFLSLIVFLVRSGAGRGGTAEVFSRRSEAEEHLA